MAEPLPISGLVGADSVPHIARPGVLPGAVLFCCTLNALRSPMAAAMLKLLHGRRVYVDSVGVRAGELDPFAVAAMDEIGLDIAKHRPKTFDELEDSSFDLIISLSPEAQHKAVEMTRTMACEVEFWNTFDPSIVEGSREQRMDVYREVRDGLMQRIRERFPVAGAPQI
jgi:protein-tyrosine-phosphatase